jgi:hypothetical protein
MEFSPLLNQTQNASRQLPFQDRIGSDRNLCFVFAVDSMKMWRRVLPINKSGWKSPESD